MVIKKTVLTLTIICISCTGYSQNRVQKVYEFNQLLDSTSKAHLIGHFKSHNLDAQWQLKYLRKYNPIFKNASVVGMCFSSLVAMVVVSLVTKPPSDETLEKFFPMEKTFWEKR